MPPRKKANASSSSSSSSKKSTQNQASQPCKYGIQHFFERHSLSSSSSQNPKTSAAAPETPKPSSERCVLQPHNKEPRKLDSKNVESKRKSGRKGSNSGGDGVGGSKRVRSGAAEQVEDLVIVDSDTQNPKNERNLRGLKRAAGAQSPKNGLNLETENTPPENLLVDLTKSEDVSEVSPEVSKCMPRKRFKFSPGMIIKQSQDDGGEEVTWKISPVNERLQAISKLAPDVVKALADASRLNSSSFQQLSDDAGKVEEGNSVHILEMPEKSPMLSNGATVKRGSQSEDKNGNVMDLKDSGGCSTQSPFRTPPSLSYHHDKPAHNAVLRECLEQRQHKKALLELLDQVESAITVEEPASELLDQVENVATVEEPASEHLDQVKNAITVEEPASERLDQVKNAVTVEEPTSEVLEQVENAITVEEPAVELLDRVENAITFEEPALVESNTSSSRHCSKISDEISVKANSPIKETAMNSLEEANVSSSDPCFLVLEVTEKRDAQYRNGAQCSSKVLRVLNEQSGEEQSVHLWDDWFYSVIEPGDTIRVIGEFDLEHKCVVNHEKNLVIVHPNLLLSGTRVAGSFGCPRRAVLDERLKSSEYSIAALTGILLHQIFQAGLLMENPSIDLLQEFAKITLQKNIESLYACGVQENDMHKTLIEAIPKICNWIALFKHSQKPNAPSIDFGANDGLRRVNICDVIDIEEMAWAPKYGLKGVIDASVRVKIHLDDGDVGEKIMPLEFKTGKATSGQSLMEHYAQLILYTLLMSERYLQPIDSGLLYYLSTDHTMGATVHRSDLIGLIMRRNELAHDIIKASMIQQLPPMLQSPNMCKGCRHLNSCAIYHKVHGGCAESSGLGNIFNSLTNHLTASHKFFFKQWDRLIDLESKELQSTKNEAQRARNSGNESSSSCLSSIVLDGSDEIHLQTYAKDNRFVYRFVLKIKSSPNDRRHNDSNIAAEDDLNCTIRPGDRVILSTESSHLAIASGIISDISRSHVSVSFSKRLRLPKSNPSSMSDLYQQVWRIDKDEVATSFTTMRYNLVQLFLRSTQSDHLRKLIVDLEAPRFDSGSVLSQDPAISYIWSERNLNDDQRRAIIKILTAKDYTLILGMPGTGKTSTMVYAVKALLMRGASILLTSYTNSAVDNLLIKLKAQGIDFARIGRCEVVHHDVRQHCLPDMHIRTMEDIKSKLDQVKVVAVTCLGISSPFLTNKKFDVCIFDEAGQTSLPVSLGPLMFASKFVLVGDHYQLPPLVKSAEARESGMSVSLFRRLSEAHPQAISALRSQYRMCAGIMKLSNALIYGDRLRCGSPDVEIAKLKLLNGKPASSWLKEVLDADKPVIFINTDTLPAFETKDHKTVSNPIEACIVAEITEALANHGVAKEEIGIITPYNSQANLIQHVLSMASVEVHTIDKYQGRDKDCILVSFVRSSPNPRVSSSSLLGDWHRINVALTRAKKKLIMVGSCKTLSKVPLLKLLIEKVDEQSGIFCMSKNDIKSKTQLKRCSHTR